MTILKFDIEDQQPEGKYLVETMKYWVGKDEVFGLKSVLASRNHRAGVVLGKKGKMFSRRIGCQESDRKW